MESPEPSHSNPSKSPRRQKPLKGVWVAFAPDQETVGDAMRKVAAGRGREARRARRILEAWEATGGEPPEVIEDPFGPMPDDGRDNMQAERRTVSARQLLLWLCVIALGTVGLIALAKRAFR